MGFGIKIENLDDYTKPLQVAYQVTGRLGTSSGKRLILPSDLFEASASATFPVEKRVQPVYFHYPQMMEDALRINIPKGFEVEAVPTAAKLGIPNEEIYKYTATQDAGGFTVRRIHAQNELIVMPKDYDGLQKYYSQFESKDQESVVLKVDPAAAAAGTPGGN